MSHAAMQPQLTPSESLENQPWALIGGG